MFIKDSFFLYCNVDSPSAGLAMHFSLTMNTSNLQQVSYKSTKTNERGKLTDQIMNSFAPCFLTSKNIPEHCYGTISQDRQVSDVTRPWARQLKTMVQILKSARDFSLPHCGPIQHAPGQHIKETIHFPLVQRLRMSGTIPPIPHTLS
jgi:hypothetical protein